MKIYERLQRQADLIHELVEELRAGESCRGVGRLVQLVVQALLDLGLMVISALGRGEPKRCSEIGFALRDLEIIGEDDVKLLRSMAGLRNITRTRLRRG